MLSLIAIIAICIAVGIINVAIWAINRPSKEVREAIAELDRQQEEIDTILAMSENTRYTKPGTTTPKPVVFTKHITKYVG